MRICLLADANSIHTARWAHAFAERGHETHVISFRPAAIDGVTVHAAGAVPAPGRMRYLAQVPRIRRLIRALRPDIVHAFHATSYGLVAALSGFHPRLVHATGRDILDLAQNSRLYRLLVRFNLANADALTATSAALARAAAELAPDASTATIIPFGVDSTVFDPARFARRRSTDDVRIGVTKALEPVYGLDILIRAFAQAKRERPELSLVLVGDGSLRRELQALADGLEVGHAVHFPGRLPPGEIPGQLARMDIFVLSAGVEGFGVGAVEAMAMELPVIATDTGGPGDIVVHERTGLLIAAHCPHALARGLVRLAGDAALRRRMGQAGRHRAMELFDWNRCVGRMLEVYGRVGAAGG
ncbi:MAG: glycosyltransferase [Gammaproteobacteria bacterium]